MKRLNGTTKLQLNKETLRALSTADMDRVHGGGRPSHDAGVCSDACVTKTCPPPPPPQG
jgi:hypothetical protein